MIRKRLFFLYGYNKKPNTIDDEKELFISSEQLRPLKKSRFAAYCTTFSLLITPIIYLIIIIETSKNVSLELEVDSLWFLSIGSESCIHLMDIYRDGLDDIIVELTEVTVIINEIKKEKGVTRHFVKMFEELCSDTVYGIRGYDCTIL
jgi:hypothetical protein